MESWRYLESKLKGENRKRGWEGRVRAGWQRRTLPHRHQCSTIRAHGLNYRVRDGAGWTPMALATNLHALQHHSPPHTLSVFTTSRGSTTHIATFTPEHPLLRTTGLSPRPLVPVSSTHCCASTSGLSNWWSTSGLTPLTGWGVSS